LEQIVKGILRLALILEHFRDQKPADFKIGDFLLVSRDRWWIGQ